MLYRSLLRRLLFHLPPETAHEIALQFLAKAPGVTRLVLGETPLEKSLELERFGLKFAHPVGLAAGFDKDGVALKGLASLGFSFIEAGTVTLHPQRGNPRPRLFRLPLDQALINRAGFNNRGADAFARRVASDSRTTRSYVLGVSIGKSKVAPLEQAVEDYVRSFELVHQVADYVAVNVSSPNTPGLRDLQQSQQLENLLKALQASNEALSKKHGMITNRPLLLKVSPDLTRAQLEDILAVSERTRISGIIATNTTIGRVGLRSSARDVEACGDGGLSGLPIRARSTQLIAQLYQLSGGAISLIGVGGIFTAADAWEKICAGASLVQLYTGFIYQGPSIVREITQGLAELMSRAGMQSLDEAVGCRAAELTT